MKAGQLSTPSHASSSSWETSSIKNDKKSTHTHGELLAKAALPGATATRAAAFPVPAKIAQTVAAGTLPVVFCLARSTPAIFIGARITIIARCTVSLVHFLAGVGYAAGVASGGFARVRGGRAVSVDFALVRRRNSLAVSPPLILHPRVLISGEAICELKEEGGFGVRPGSGKSERSSWGSPRTYPYNCRPYSP